MTVAKEETPVEVQLAGAVINPSEKEIDMTIISDTVAPTVQQALDTVLNEENFAATIHALNERHEPRNRFDLTVEDVRNKVATFIDSEALLAGEPSEWIVLDEGTDTYRLCLFRGQIACSVPDCDGHDVIDADQWADLSHTIGRHEFEFGEVLLIQRDGKKHGNFYLNQEGDFELSELPSMITKLEQSIVALQELQRDAS